MKAFVSWSGGKDCMFALYSFLQASPQNQVSYLINFCDSELLQSRSHGLESSLIQAQAEAIGIPLIQEPVTRGTYELHLKKVINQLKAEGIHTGVFGDIYLDVHRDWIERVCAEMDITPVFPLWGESTTSLMHKFIDAGFRTLLVSVKDEARFHPLLGKEMNYQLLNQLLQMEGVDPCGENGEYHTYVFDGPFFSYPVPYKPGEPYFADNHLLLPIKL